MATLLFLRPHGLGTSLIQQLTAANINVVPLPGMVITNNLDININKIIQELPQYHKFIFTSVNAVQYSQELVRALALLPHIQCYAIGQQTAAHLAIFGVTAITAATANSESLLALADFANVTALKIAIIRGTIGRNLLETTLAARQAHLTVAKVYQQQCPEQRLRQLPAFTNQQPYFIFITSVAILENLLTMLDQAAHQQLYQQPLIVLSKRIQDAARSMGFQQTLVITDLQQQAQQILQIILPSLEYPPLSMAHFE